MINYNDLREAIKELGTKGNEARHSPLYRVLKEELSKIGYWRQKPRGDSRKGYELGMGKNRR